MPKKAMVKQAWSSKVPEGDNVERKVCRNCDYVAYENPKNVVGSVVSYQDKILLCRRAIEPRKGFWTLPAGYLELNETTQQGACREAFEEAGANIAIESLLAIYEIPHASQLHVYFKAHLKSPQIKAGEESLEVKLFSWEEIPWEDLAFPSVHHALKAYKRTLNKAGHVVEHMTLPPTDIANRKP
jgi:ADP-ribose pyrophosphatase YjhB (NUDIX family)